MRHHRTDGAAILEEGAIAVLLFTASRHKILDHQFTGRNKIGRLFKAAYQLFAAVHPPGLGLGIINEMLLNGRLEDEWKITIDGLQILHLFREPRLRNQYSKLLG